MAIASLTSSHILIDGAFGAVFDPQDRGLMYGDGVFRTLRMSQGRPRWWQDHLDKLRGDAGRLAIPEMPDSAWQADLERLSGVIDEGVLKLVLTRGSGPRGYALPEPCFPRRLVLYTPLERSAIEAGDADATVRVCQLRLARQPALAGIKHLNRLENILARAEWHDPAIHEGLLLDQDGRVISGVMSNLFLWRDGRLLTPKLTECGVAGVTRMRLMGLALSSGMQVEVMDLYLDDVLAADEAMLTNSIFGLRRIARLEGRTWTLPVVSERLRTLLNA